MSTYAIGDVQGCFKSLMQLLALIHFDEKKDKLWFTGDLVNRGPESLETLRFVKSLGDRALTVLGNHDLTLLAVAHHITPFKSTHHTFDDILQAADKNSLLEWLQQQPLFHFDPHLNFCLVHAGIHPKWDLEQTLSLSQEVELALRGPKSKELLKSLYGNEPNFWDPNLMGYDRLRFIINCFTRLRFFTANGSIDFTIKESLDGAPAEFTPWFLMPNRSTENIPTLFGHWAALQGKCPVQNVFALDTGCIWGGALTAMRLEDSQRFSISCPLD